MFAQINGDKISISSELIDHHGEILFRKKVEDKINKFKQLSRALGEEIIKIVGQQKINELDNLNDFNYTAKK